MAAALERSWRLLVPGERRALRRLAVLPGGFTRTTASAVGGATIATLARLVDSSLLRCDESGRFDRHPLVNAFVRGKLADRPEEARDAKRSLAHHALDLIASAAGEGDPDALARAHGALEAERANLWAAFEAVDPAVREQDVVQALETLAGMFEHRSRAGEGGSLLPRLGRPLVRLGHSLQTLRARERRARAPPACERRVRRRRTGRGGGAEDRHVDL